MLWLLVSFHMQFLSFRSIILVVFTLLPLALSHLALCHLALLLKPCHLELPFSLPSRNLLWLIAICIAIVCKKHGAFMDNTFSGLIHSNGEAVTFRPLFVDGMPLIHPHLITTYGPSNWHGVCQFLFQLCVRRPASTPNHLDRIAIVRLSYCIEQ